MEEYYLNYFTEENASPFFIQYGGHTKDLTMHRHNDFSELVIVLSGEALHLVNQEKFHIKQGDIFVIHNQTAHAYQNVHNFRICNIMYRPDWIDFDHMDIGQTPGFQALFVLEPFYAKNAHFYHRLYLNAPELFSISEQIKELIREYNGNQPGRRTILYAKFIELVVALSRYYEIKADNDKEDTPVMLLAYSLAYLKQHFRENISIQELALDANYSLRHFDRLFKELYHTTPQDYIISLRLSYACKLMKTSDKKITEIALESGFENVNYFFRIFKKKFHTTPRLWKLQNQTEKKYPAEISAG